MNDNILRVRITKGASEGGNQVNANASEVSFAPSGGEFAKANEGKISDIRTGAINAGLIGLGKQALSYGLSNYGDLTGDHIGQTRLNEGLEVAGLVGMALSSPVGAIAALGSVGIKAANRYIDVKKSEIASEALRQRVGLSRSGSR
jgi:hypothetical protein